MKWLSDLIKKKSLIFVGAELTLLYFLFFGFICFHYVDYPKNLTLNELGDLLAGMFAPLAFLWMVITIFMQSNELKLQREELSMQREELANSSAQLERQSNVMESQYAMEQKEAQISEIESKLTDFVEMLVAMKLIGTDYKQNIFNGRVTTPGFFKHVDFVHLMENLSNHILRVREADSNLKSQADIEGRNYVNFVNNVYDLIAIGGEITQLSQAYGLENLVEETRFNYLLGILHGMTNEVK